MKKVMMYVKRTFVVAVALAFAGGLIYGLVEIGQLTMEANDRLLSRTAVAKVSTTQCGQPISIKLHEPRATFPNILVVSGKAYVLDTQAWQNFEDMIKSRGADGTVIKKYREVVEGSVNLMDVSLINNNAKNACPSTSAQ